MSARPLSPSGLPLAAALPLWLIAAPCLAQIERLAPPDLPKLTGPEFQAAEVQPALAWLAPPLIPKGEAVFPRLVEAGRSLTLPRRDTPSRQRLSPLPRRMAWSAATQRLSEAALPRRMAWSRFFDRSGLRAREPGAVSAEGEGFEIFSGADGPLVAAVREGSGLPVLFVPGLAGDLVFETQKRELLSRPQRPLAILHRRDFSPEGLPDHSPHPDPIAAAAQDLDSAVHWLSRRFARPDGSPSPVLLVGHSFGATVINEFARTPGFSANQALVAGVLYSNPFLPSDIAATLTSLSRFIISLLPWPARPAAWAVAPIELDARGAREWAHDWVARLVPAEKLHARSLAQKAGRGLLGRYGFFRQLAVHPDLQDMLLAYLQRRRLDSLLDEVHAFLNYEPAREEEGLAAVRRLGWRVRLMGNAGDPFIPETSLRRLAQRLGQGAVLFAGRPGWFRHAPMMDPEARAYWNAEIEKFHRQTTRSLVRKA